MQKDTPASWQPTKAQKENFSNDRYLIDQMYEYRSYEEVGWTKAAKKWNMIASVSDSFYIPVTRNATYTGLVAMRQSLPKIGLITEDPGDRKKADFIKDLNDHVDRTCGMEEVMDQLMVDYAVLGNGVLEDYVEYAYKKKRSKKLDKNGKWTGGWTEYYERDLTRPKIGTRARSPWECAFEPGSRTVSEIRACTFRDVLTEEEFKEIYAHGKTDIYINTEHVKPGKVFMFSDDDDKAVERDIDSKKIVVQHFQDERTDSYRIYANGILIQDESLSDFHAHGKITLSLITNHHMYDDDLKSHRLYGKGDPELLCEIDDLINAVTNQFIRNYERKNTTIIGVEGIGAIEDIDLTGDEIINGRITAAALGQADLAEFDAMMSRFEEIAIQTVKKNYKRLEGEAAKTAYEAAQKQKSENIGMTYQIKRIENVGLKAHYQKRISDMFEYLTEEEVVDVTETTVEAIKSMGWKDLPKEDFVMVDGKPVQMKYRTKFRTSGKVFEEKLINGKRHIDGLRQMFEFDGTNGVLTAHAEYLWTREWIYRRDVPEVYIESGSTLGQDNLIEMANLERLFGLYQAITQMDPEFKPSWQEFAKSATDLLDKRREQFLQDGDTELEKEEELVQTAIDAFKNPQSLQAQPLPDFGQGQIQAPSPQPGSVGSIDQLLSAQGSPLA